MRSVSGLVNKCFCLIVTLGLLPAFLRAEVVRMETIGIQVTVPEGFKVGDKSELAGANSGIDLVGVLGGQRVKIGGNGLLLNDLIIVAIHKRLEIDEIRAGATKSEISGWAVYTRLVKYDDRPDLRSQFAFKKFGDVGLVFSLFTEPAVDEAQSTRLLRRFLNSVKKVPVAPGKPDRVNGD